MQVKEIRTKDPGCCTPETNLQKVATLMCDFDCGEIPVIDSLQSMKPVGVVTDRDIVCRTVAKGKNALQMTAKDCMTRPVVTARPEMSIDECCELMEKHQIRRIPVVDQKGACCGIVAQADVAKYAPEEESAEVLKEISRSGGRAMAAA